MFNLTEDFCIDPFTLPSLQVNLCGEITVSNLGRSAVPAKDGRREKLSSSPRDIHYESAASAEPFDRTTGPRSWKRGKKFYLSGLLLQEHLCDSRCACSISIHSKDVLLSSSDTTARKGKEV